MAVLLGLFVSSTLLAQGPLTPPGAPAPSGKTLSQIEPRTDVATLAGDATAMVVISQPGSYFLSANISITGSKVGIAIASNDVTIDLSGFVIVGNATSPAGIDFRGSLGGCRISNGQVAGLTSGVGVRSISFSNRITQCAFEDLGIRQCAKGFDLYPVNDVRVERVRVSNATTGGIDLNGRGTVANCMVDTVSGGAAAISGIRADVVRDCFVTNITGGTITGIDATQVIDCRVKDIGNASSTTVRGIQGALTRGCLLESISGTSVTGISGGEVVDSRISSLSQLGGSSSSAASAILADSILDCSATGLHADSSSNLTAFYRYQLASRCRVGSIGADNGGAAGFRPSGSSSQTLDSGASSIGLNIGIDLEESTGAVIRNCRFNLSGAGIGISCNGTGVRIEDNVITGCTVGINAGSSSTAGLIIRNRVTNCTLPIVFNASTWQVGPRISAFGDITTTNPWANFVD